MNQIKAQIIEDGSIHKLGYSDPRGDNAYGPLSEDFIVAQTWGGKKDEAKDEEALFPASDAPSEWPESIGEIRSELAKHGCRIHAGYYKELQTFFDAVQAHDFDEEFIGNYVK
jgi:hypothetical protein